MDRRNRDYLYIVFKSWPLDEVTHFDTLVSLEQQVSYFGKRAFKTRYKNLNGYAYATVGCNKEDIDEVRDYFSDGIFYGVHDKWIRNTLSAVSR